MSYDKQTWKNGDVITANGLNHMEDGIAGGGGVLSLSEEPDPTSDGYAVQLNHTWQEIKDAVLGVFTNASEDETGKYYMKEIVVVADYSEVTDDPPEHKYQVETNNNTYYCDAPSENPWRPVV